MLDRYVVLDIETTGLNHKKDMITEIAAIKVEDQKIIDKYQALVNPEMPIPENVKELTGITNDMVNKKPIIKKVLPEFNNFLEDDVFVAHNVRFDHSFLDYNSRKYLEKPIKNKTLCTVKLAKKIFPDIASCRLESLCNYFEIENKQAHRAMSDVLATNKLFLKFQAILHNNGYTEHNQIFDFFSNPNLKLNLSTSIF